MRKLGWLLVLPVLLGAVIGCSEEENITDPVPEVTLPSDPDVLMSEFVTLYEGLDSTRLAQITHDSARAFLLPTTIQEWAQGDRPLDFQYFDRDTLLTIHQNIFSGNQGVDSVGFDVPPVDTVVIGFFQKLEAWGIDQGVAEDFPDMEVYSALFSGLIYFNYLDSHRFEVHLQAVFYVCEIDEPGLSGWQLLGWRESDPYSLTNTESAAWGQILAMYR